MSPMNIFEYNLLIACLTTLFLYSYYIPREKNLKFSVFITIAFIPVLCFSISKSLSFLSVDETYIILEATDLRNSDMRQWNLGCLRTTDVTIGIIFSVLNLLIDFSENYNIPKIIAKALHWYVGFISILFIHFLMDKYFFKNENRELNFILFMGLFLLFPANGMALIIFNYDLFSMLFGIIGIIYMCVLIKNHDKKAGLLAIIIAMFAAQEKLSASPILLMSIFMFTYCSYQDSKVFYDPDFRKRLGVLLLYAGIALCAALSVSVLSHLIVGLARGGSFPPLKGLAHPLISWIWPIVGKLSIYQSLKADPIFHIFIILAELLGIVLLSEFIRFITSHLENKESADSAVNYFQKHKYKLVLLVFVSTLIIGVIGNFFPSEILIDPVIPVAPGNYQPPAFNERVGHYGASSLTTHTLIYIMKCYAAFFNALPTVLILLMIFTLLFLKRGGSSAWFIIGVSALAAPLAYGLTLTPAGMRYLNIPLLLFLVFLLYLFDKLMISRNLRISVIFVTILVVFSEVIPFAPIHGTFRPIWLNYPDEFSHSNPVGRTRSGVWGGWGEEIMIAGKKIEQICSSKEINCDDIRLYYILPGDWLDAKIPVKIFSVIRDDLRFTENDYYVINRSVFMYGGKEYLKFETVQPCKGEKNCLNFDVVPPELTISYRGLIQAWIFRGDQLRPKNET